MPVDFKTQKNAIQGQINDLLADRKSSIPIEFENTEKNLETGRMDFLSRLGQQAGPNAPSFNASIDTTSDRLGLAASKQLAESRFSADRERLNNIYDNALRMALEAGKDTQSAMAFARQVQADEEARKFEAERMAKQRTGKVKQSNMADLYSGRGADLTAMYGSGNDLNSAMLRVLFGLGTSVATAYGMNKMNKVPNAGNIPKSNPVAGESGNADFIQPEEYTKSYYNGFAGGGY